jgi:hypothetical protein
MTQYDRRRNLAREHSHYERDEEIACYHSVVFSSGNMV